MLYSARSDYFFQVVLTAMSIVSGAVAERMKLWAFLAFAIVMTGVIYPVQGSWSWGGGALAEASPTLQAPASSTCAVLPHLVCSCWVRG